MHRLAPKGSGGVGVLVKEWVFNEYQVQVADKSFEGILSVKFTHKQITNCLLSRGTYLQRTLCWVVMLKPFMLTYLPKYIYRKSAIQ